MVTKVLVRMNDNVKETVSPAKFWFLFISQQQIVVKKVSVRLNDNVKETPWPGYFVLVSV